MSELHAWYASLPWIGAEGTQQEWPLLIRARRLPEEVVGHRDFPYLLNIILRYSPVDQTGLPSADQYDEIGDFEKRVIDALESSEQGLATFIKTWNGVVRYVLYVQNADFAMQLISSSVSDKDSIEISAAKDEDWARYRALRKMVSE